MLQKPESLVVYDAIPVQSNYCPGESSNNVESGNYEDCGNYVVDFEQPIEEEEEEEQKPIIRDGSIQPCSLFPGEQIGCGAEDEKAVNLEASNDNVFVADTCYGDIPTDDASYMPEEPFIEDDSNFEDYLNFFDDEDAQNWSLDVSQLLGSEEGLDQKVSFYASDLLSFSLFVESFLTHSYISSLPLKNWRRRRKVAKDLLQNKMQMSLTWIQVDVHTFLFKQII